MDPSGAWSLDPRLEADSLFVCDLPVSQLRLQNDARWPWLVLIPRQPDLVELEDLAPAERAALAEEIVRAGRAARLAGAAMGFEVEKLNVGALGNVVRQLHVHVIGRRPDDDPAGRGPVWGVASADPFVAVARDRVLAAARRALL